MKKLLSAMFLIIVLCVSAGTVSAREEYIGDMYSTNTTAYIDTHQIPVYVFNGYPYVVAEDLGGYAFAVRWSQYENTLYMEYNEDYGYIPYQDVIPTLINTYAGPVFSSDVRVVMNGKEIPAYSLNGRMLVSLDEMYRFGRVNWYAASRTIGVTTHKFIRENPDWETLLPPFYLKRKIDDTFYAAIPCFYNWNYNIMNTYDYHSNYYDVMRISDKDYNELRAAKNYIDETLSWISNDQYLYERGNLYHLAYNTLYALNGIEEAYNMINKHSVAWMDKNLDKYCTISDSIDAYINEIQYISGNLYDAIDKYIYVVYG